MQREREHGHRVRVIVWEHDALSSWRHYLPLAGVFVVRPERAQVDAVFEGQLQIDVAEGVRPGPEPHVALLRVEREVGDVYGAGALEDLVGYPLQGTVREHHHPGVSRRPFRIRSRKTSVSDQSK